MSIWIVDYERDTQNVLRNIIKKMIRYPFMTKSHGVLGLAVWASRNSHN